MQVGCGATTKEIHGRRYLYFWHYEERGGRRVQVHQYLGSMRSEEVRAKLLRAIADYYDRVAEELHHRRAEALARASIP